MPAGDECLSLREQIEFACLDDSLTWPLQHLINATVHFSANSFLSRDVSQLFFFSVWFESTKALLCQSRLRRRSYVAKLENLLSSRHKSFSAYSKLTFSVPHKSGNRQSRKTRMWHAVWNMSPHWDCGCNQMVTIHQGFVSNRLEQPNKNRCRKPDWKHNKFARQASKWCRASQGNVFT